MAIRDGQDLQSIWACRNCIRIKNFGKRNCKKCSERYTSEFKSASLIRQKEYRREKREARHSSPKELVEAYSFVRDKIAEPRYLPHPSRIIFTYKRKNTSGGWCHKGRKEIRIGYLYKDLYEKGKKESLYRLMIHEALHLRLPHHRKYFHIKEKAWMEKFDKLGIIKDSEMQTQPVQQEVVMQEVSVGG